MPDGGQGSMGHVPVYQYCIVQVPINLVLASAGQLPECFGR